jgi:hypothetical protein
VDPPRRDGFWYPLADGGLTTTAEDGLTEHLYNISFKMSRLIRQNQFCSILVGRQFDWSSLVWVRRTPDEVARWHEITRQHARLHGLTIAGFVWILTTMLGVGGVFYTRAGLLLRSSVVGGFWTRLLVFAMAALLMSYWVYRSEIRKEIGGPLRRTICPSCGKGGEKPIGTNCDCGQALVPQSTMKWVEDK